MRYEVWAKVVLTEQVPNAKGRMVVRRSLVDRLWSDDFADRESAEAYAQRMQQTYFQQFHVREFPDADTGRPVPEPERLGCDAADDHPLAPAERGVAEDHHRPGGDDQLPYG